MSEEYNQHDVAVYGGYVNQHDKLMKSASGGIATALAEEMISRGGYVAGVAYTSDFRNAEYILTNNMADLERFKGSKYIDPIMNHIYQDVKALLEAGEQVLFIGFPCRVAALYQILGSRPDNLWTCELVCHGPTNPKVQSDYIDYLEQKYHSRVVDFSVRYKKKKWTPTYVYAKFENGKTFCKLLSETEFGYGFSVLAKEGCFQCKFKGNHRQGDIMVGDFWGASSKNTYWNPYGVSVIFAETQKGNAYLQSLSNVRLFETTFEEAVKKNSKVITSRKKDRRCDQFSKLLKEHDLFYAMKHTMTTKDRIIRVLKKFIPQKLVPFVKDIFHSIKKK